MKTTQAQTYDAFRKRILDARGDAKKLEHLETRITTHYDVGTLTASGLRKLGVLIMDLLAEID